MFKKFFLALAALALFSVPAWSTTYSPCQGLSLPTPNDPAVANIWGTILNTNTTMIDSSLGGSLALSVAGNTNVVLTGTNGAPDQSRNKYFNFSGVLTGNIYVLFPVGRCESIIVHNSTTGAFTLSIGANDGAGAPAGTTYPVSQGQTVTLYTDGVNVIPANTLVQSSGPCATAPTVGGSTGNPTVTYAVQVCEYVKTGFSEIVTTKIRISAILGGSGNLVIRNALNDAPSTTTNLNGGCSYAFISGLYMGQPTSTHWGVEFVPGSKDLNILEMGATTTSNAVASSPITGVQSTFGIEMTCSFKTQS